MDRSVEALKQVNLVDFLARQYGLEFRRRGAAFACRSPFTEDTRPSFFVRLVKEHWLFKDFSSGAGGTIFDFVRMKEKLGSFREALSLVRGLFSGSASPALRALVLHVCGEGRVRPAALPGQPCGRGEGEVPAGRQVPFQPGMEGAAGREGGLPDRERLG